MASDDKQPHVTEKESLRVAEAARQTEWERPSFMRELFLGSFRQDLIHPYPLPGASGPSSPPSTTRLRDFLRDDVDAAEIDRTGEYPAHVLDGLRRLGAFGIKIPKEYGGLGFTHVEYAPRDGAARQPLTATSRRCSRPTSRSACRRRC